MIRDLRVGELERRHAAAALAEHGADPFAARSSSTTDERSRFGPPPSPPRASAP